ncbi:hypothetical protein CYY_004674 [Polysphondylium violaceum]|uniref:Uncharacterized protein n=1 Tax=Polysphondylium violaceum TaxID=133409 RepID=A0A8J4V075_9MYCE|nr:hypothetical protein CYY_004674 [Polysphondylium violaceum]
MKSITTTLLLLCLVALGFVNTLPIKGYGNLTPYNIYTYDEVSRQKYAQPLTPQPQQVFAFAGLSDTKQSFNMIYSKGKDSITWGTVNYIDGTVSDQYTFAVPTPVTLKNVNGVQWVQKDNNSTLYYLTIDKVHGDNIVHWVTSAILDGHSDKVTVWPIGFSDIAQGAFDYTTELDYYAVLIDQYALYYKAYWFDPYFNQTLKVANFNVPVSPIFKIFAYEKTLYIVQPSSTSNNFIEISSLNWSDETVTIVAKIPVSTQPNQLDIYVNGNFIIVSSTGLNQPQPDVALIYLQSFAVLDYIQGLSSGPGSNYYIY